MSISRQNLTAVIVTFKSENVIHDCIRSISESIKIILVDNSMDKEFKAAMHKKGILINYKGPEAYKKHFQATYNTKKNIYHHLGIYCYQLKTLENFVSLSRSQNEVEYRLEQLRALDNNIKINVTLAKSSPIGVDTKDDFLAIKKIMEYK